MASPLDSRRPTSSSSPSQDPELSPLEQQVLDEYATLVGNLDNVRFLVPHPPSQSALTGYSAAVRNSWRTRGEPLSRDPGLAARAGAQDGDGLHAAEGERVLHRAAAGDSGRGRGVAFWALKGIFVNLCSLVLFQGAQGEVEADEARRQLRTGDGGRVLAFRMFFFRCMIPGMDAFAAIEDRQRFNVSLFFFFLFRSFVAQGSFVAKRSRSLSPDCLLP